jgi:arylesterase / paraoxonase
MKKVLIFLLVLVVSVAAWIINLMWSAGSFKTIEPHFSGTCREIRGVVGAEDITIHPLTAMAYISVCDRRAVDEGKSAGGGIYAYNLKAENPSPVKLTSGPGTDFQPHGISLYIDPGGQETLFVVNHSGGTHKIEIYDFQDGRLIHRKTVSDTALVSPNDIVAVASDRFYISNDHGYTSGIMKFFEEYLKLRLSNVVYYNGTKFSEAATKIGYANGINVSQDGKTLYLCAITEMSLIVFNRNLETGALSLREKIPLDTGGDNIEIGPSGDLWIGSHPQLLKFVAHKKDPGKISPSQVLRIEIHAPGKYRINEVYLDSGREISGSSVCAVYKKRMLVGSVFEEKFLDCLME